MKEKFRVIILEEASEFIDKLDEKSRDKIIYNLNKAKFTREKELFEKLQGEIWEFRTLYNKTYYRLLAFWDKTLKADTLVVTTHGMVKKPDKMPQVEIDKAERIRKLYFKQKENEK